MNSVAVKIKGEDLQKVFRAVLGTLYTFNQCLPLKMFIIITIVIISIYLKHYGFQRCF